MKASSVIILVLALWNVQLTYDLTKVRSELKKVELRCSIQTLQEIIEVRKDLNKLDKAIDAKTLNQQQ